MKEVLVCSFITLYLFHNANKIVFCGIEMPIELENRDDSIHLWS